VEFFQGGTNLIATLTAPPYSFTWTAVPQGTYSLTAVATDNLSGTRTSAAVSVTVDRAPALNFVHVDHLNTPRLVSDAAGTTVWKWDQQEPFGNNVADENPSGLGAFDLPLRLPGQYVDRETNLHYNYFRDYDTSLGRYTRSDPVGLRGGINTYLYAMGNPMIYTDVLGQEPATNSDALMCIRHPFECNDVRKCRDAAQQATRDRFGRAQGHNDRADAFRHCHWSCCMAQKLGGPERAEAWGNAHENDPTQPMCERRMDLVNNAVGRALGTLHPKGDCGLMCDNSPLAPAPIGDCSPCGDNFLPYN
jgi:RHS repeat-associated protein